MKKVSLDLPKSLAPKPLKSLDVPVAPAATEATDATDKLTLVLGTEAVPSDEVKKYNHADAQEKAWKKIKDSSRPKLSELALAKLYDHNTANPDAAAKTVCLVDTTGAACNVSLKDTYDKTQHDPEKVTNGLLLLGQRDPNKFVAEKVIIGFDTTVFYDEHGCLRQEFYIDVMEALQELAEKHSVASPFSSSKVVTVKPGFAGERWKAFKREQQPAVTSLFPATVSLTPVAPEKKAKV